MMEDFSKSILQSLTLFLPSFGKSVHNVTAQRILFLLYLSAKELIIMDKLKFSCIYFTGTEYINRLFQKSSNKL